MRTLSEEEILEKAEFVKKCLSQGWSIHVSLRKAMVSPKYQPYIRILVAKELAEYRKRVNAKRVSSTGIETSYA